MNHVNQIRPYSKVSIFELKHGIHEYYSGFRRILWTHKKKIQNMRLMFLQQFAFSSLCCTQTNNTTFVRLGLRHEMSVGVCTAAGKQEY